MTTTAPADLTAFELLTSKVMVNATRTMAGRLSIASVPSPVGSQEPTYVDTYRINGDRIEPVITLSGLGGLAMTLIHDLVAATPKDFTVVTTTVKKHPEDAVGRRIIIGMGADARPVVGGLDVQTTIAENGLTQTLSYGSEVEAMDFKELPAGLRDWMFTMVKPAADPTIHSITRKLSHINNDHVGIFVYGQGPLGILQQQLVARGFLGTDAGSSANIDTSNPPALIDLMIALLSVLTPDQTYQDIAAQRSMSQQASN